MVAGTDETVRGLRPWNQRGRRHRRRRRRRPRERWWWRRMLRSRLPGWSSVRRVGILRSPSIRPQNRYDSAHDPAVFCVLRLVSPLRIRRRRLHPTGVDHVSGRRLLGSVAALSLPASKVRGDIVFRANQLHPSALYTNQLVCCCFTHVNIITCYALHDVSPWFWT